MISAAGRHEFRRGECTCLSCGAAQGTGAVDFVLHGAWPCSPDVDKAVTFVDERVMMALSAAKHSSPGLATRGWLAALSEAGQQYGGTVSPSPHSVYPCRV